MYCILVAQLNEAKAGGLLETTSFLSLGHVVKILANQKNSPDSDTNQKRSPTQWENPNATPSLAYRGALEHSAKTQFSTAYHIGEDFC